MERDKVRLEEQEETMVTTFEKTFGWFAVLNRVAIDDVTRHDEIITKSVIEILNQLSYLIEKDKELIRLQKKAQQKG
jgi:hypothetical protein